MNKKYVKMSAEKIKKEHKRLLAFLLDINERIKRDIELACPARNEPVNKKKSLH